MQINVRGHWAPFILIKMWRLIMVQEKEAIRAKKVILNWFLVILRQVGIYGSFSCIQTFYGISCLVRSLIWYCEDIQIHTVKVWHLFCTVDHEWKKCEPEKFWCLEGNFSNWKKMLNFNFKTCQTWGNLDLLPNGK